MIFKITDPNGKEVFSVESTNPTRSEESVVGTVLTTIMMLPFILMAICGIIGGISSSIDKHKRDKFIKKNRKIVEQITKLLTDSANKFIKRLPEIVKDSKDICDKINKSNDAYTFKPCDDILDYLKPEVLTERYLKEIIKLAKTKTGKVNVSDTVCLFYTGIDFDKLPDNTDLDGGNDGWYGFYDNAVNMSMDGLTRIKKKFPDIVTDVGVDIAGDDFGGSGQISLGLTIDVTELHTMLQNVDVSDLR